MIGVRIVRRGEIFKIRNSILFQVKFHVFLYRYYETMVKKIIFRCLGFRKFKNDLCLFIVGVGTNDKHTCQTKLA